MIGQTNHQNPHQTPNNDFVPAPTDKQPADTLVQANDSGKQASATKKSNGKQASASKPSRLTTKGQGKDVSEATSNGQDNFGGKLDASKGAKPKPMSAKKGQAPATATLKSFFKPQATPENPQTNNQTDHEMQAEPNEASPQKLAEPVVNPEDDVEMSHVEEPPCPEQIQTNSNENGAKPPEASVEPSEPLNAHSSIAKVSEFSICNSQSELSSLLKIYITFRVNLGFERGPRLPSSPLRVRAAPPTGSKGNCPRKG